VTVRSEARLIEYLPSEVRGILSVYV